MEAMEKQRYPEPAVGALIFHKGRMLLVRGERSGQLWVIPGGHVETGEPIEAALRREIREETGLEISKSRLFGIQECMENTHYIFLDFICEAVDDRVVLNEEHQDYKWCTIAEATELPLNAYTAKFIQEYLKGDGSRYARTVIYNYYP
jgi:nucleoside triphosphatase